MARGTVVRQVAVRAGRAPRRPADGRGERAMPLKDILVHLDASEACACRLDLAAGLARRHDAHLVGLHAVDLLMPAAALADGGTGAGAAMLYDQMRASALAAAGRIEAGFRERLRRDGLSGEWRLAEGGPAGEAVALHARYADLAVLGQQDPDGTEPNGAILHATLFGSGRPVLVVPYAGRFAQVGRRVLIGWNAGREAARAVNDAIPLLDGAEEVTVLAVNPRRGIGGHGDVPAADMALHLARHGLRATAEHVTAPEIADAEALLNAAAEKSADLLVVGAYGHSRLREMVMGGVTRTLLRSMTVPVLMAH
jgi:nucleotide-binding universal stress UspA family protein